jgi:hypothetical protein
MICPWCEKEVRILDGCFAPHKNQDGLECPTSNDEVEKVQKESKSLEESARPKRRYAARGPKMVGGKYHD